MGEEGFRNALMPDFATLKITKFLYYYSEILLSGASAANVEFHHFSIFKTRSVSQWPENPTICDDIEMARYAVVSSIIPWGCRGLKSPASPTSPFYFRGSENIDFLSKKWSKLGENRSVWDEKKWK